MEEMSPDLAITAVLLAFPEWAPHIVPAGSRPQDSALLETPHVAVFCPANGPEHVLTVRVVGNTVEVSYSDGITLAPANIQFGAAPGQPLPFVAPAAVAFIKGLAAGTIRLVRETLPGGRSQLSFIPGSQAAPSKGQWLPWRESWQ